ncbi:hypothetical protein PUN28_009540 [Cardiocondyla obscurior]|uniref:Uncharacterized protein n=1 Tax=Cardiocondyla obscurior TaxID=286306 RepID=A0AAW2FT57_9HYME
MRHEKENPFILLSQSPLLCLDHHKITAHVNHDRLKLYSQCLATVISRRSLSCRAVHNDGHNRMRHSCSED